VGHPLGHPTGVPPPGHPFTGVPPDKILHVFQVKTTHELIREAPLEGLPTAEGEPGGGMPGGVPHE